MTIDEAIKKLLSKAEEQEYVSQIIVELHRDESDREHKAACDACASENRQIAEWLTELKAWHLLMDKVCGELAELYGSPCQEPKAEDFMRKNGFCEDCKIIFSDKECWFRYFQRKIKQNWIGEAEALKLIGDGKDER